MKKKRWENILINDIDIVVKELTVQENDIEMYINMKKKLHSHSFSQPADSKTKIQKIQPYSHKKLEHFFKKGVKLQKSYQTCSPTELAGWEKKESKKLPKKNNKKTLSLESEKLKDKRKWEEDWGRERERERQRKIRLRKSESNVFEIENEIEMRRNGERG